MGSRIMYIERKGSGPHTDQHPAYVGRVTLSKSGKTLHYRGKTFTRHHDGESNHIDEETGDKYWISGCRKDGRDRSCPGLVEVDEDVREEYWMDIRKMPDSKDQKTIREVGKSGKRPPRQL